MIRKRVLDAIDRFLADPDAHVTTDDLLPRRIRRRRQPRRNKPQKQAELSKATAKRRKANKLARKKRRINRRNQVPHTRTAGR